MGPSCSTRPRAVPTSYLSLPADAPLPLASPDASAAAPVAPGDDDAWLASTRWSMRPDAPREGVTSMVLSGLTCAACAGAIEASLSALPGVLEARVHYGDARAELRWDPSRLRPADWEAALKRGGYGCAPDVAASSHALRHREGRASLWRLFVAGFCMMQVMMYATPSYVASPGDIPADLQRLLAWACWVLSIPVLLFSAGPFFRAAWQQLRHRRIGMDVPVSLGIAVTFVVSTGATFEPGGVFGHEVYFDSLTMFVAFLLTGRWLELRARHRAASALEAMVSRRAETAWRVEGEGVETQVPVTRLRAGDRVRVRAGDAMPADGMVLGGSSAADESLLTGESRPVPKRCGDSVLAGSLNLHGVLTLELTHVGADTRLEAIVALMRGAMSARPALMRLADRIAGPFLWIVLLLAATAAAVWSVIDPSRAVWVAVSVLIVTCPCALALAAPSALLTAAGALSRRGVLVRRPDAMESLARLDLLFLDKTGTLTEDRLELAGVEPLDLRRHDECTLRRMAASMASLSSHPLSRSLVEALAVPTTAELWTEVHEQAGAGIEALDAEGLRWRLGSAAWVGVEAPVVADDGVHVWFGRPGAPALRFDFDEHLRAGAIATVQALRSAGIELRLLSGDTPARVQRLAIRLGVPVAAAGASPEGKLAALRAAQAEGRCVGMVGDGLNDAPTLAAADVSFAMGQGAAVARAQADVVLLGDRLDAVATAHGQAGRTMRVMRQGLGWAVAYNLVAIPLALAGLLPPWAAGLGMALSSLVVVGNAMRLARLPEGH